MPRCYFTSGTSLYALERQMMQVPRQELEQYALRLSHRTPQRERSFWHLFHYQSENVDCKLCVQSKSRKTCQPKTCPYLGERIEAGVADLQTLLQDHFSSVKNQEFQKRLYRLFPTKSCSLFLNSYHREQWLYYWNYHFQFSHTSPATRKKMAALYLFSAYFDVWRRVGWKNRDNDFAFDLSKLRGIQTELYGVFYVGKSIALGKTIDFDDLASPELISDEAFRLIIYALLIAQYGSAVLRLDGNRGE